MSTLKEQMSIIGKKATIRMGGLTVQVKILDYKNSYGNDRWLVTPVAGEDEVWVEQIKIDKN